LTPANVVLGTFALRRSLCGSVERFFQDAMSGGAGLAFMVVRYLFHRVSSIFARYVEFLEISAAELWSSLKPEPDVILTMSGLKGAFLLARDRQIPA